MMALLLRLVATCVFDIDNDRVCNRNDGCERLYTCTQFPEAEIANPAGSALSQTHAWIVGSKPAGYMNVSACFLYCLIVTEALRSAEPLPVAPNDHLLCSTVYLQS